jgi:CRP-like cAMP-binding protein
MDAKVRAAPGLASRREALRGAALFRVLTEAELDAVLARAVNRRFDRGETILRRGDPGNSMMVVLQGQVRLVIESAEGQEVSIGVLGQGEVLGEMALLDGGTRSADAVGASDGVLMVIPRDDFLPMLEHSASLCLRLMQVLCARLRQANAATEEMATLSVAGRLGRVLLRLAENYGTQAAGELRLPLRLSQKDLGTMIAASREKVNRALRHWEDEGALVRDGGAWLIRDPEALRHVKE